MLKKAVLIVFTVLLISLIGVGLELYLRHIQYAYYPMHIQVLGATSFGDDSVEKNDWRYFHMYTDTAFVYDPVLIWRPNPAYTIDVNGRTVHFFNSEGYPGPLIQKQNTANTYRILALGDSNTLGLREYDETIQREVSWPAYLQHLMGDSSEVINAAAWGYTTYQMQKRFYEMLEYSPSLVLLSPSGNDGHNVGTPDSKYSKTQVALDNILIEYKIPELFQSGIDKIKSSLSAKDEERLKPRVSIEEFQDILLNLIAETSKRSIQLVFMTRPHQESLNPNYNAKKYNELVKIIARQHSIPLIDIDAYFSSKDEFFIDPTHLNKEGLKTMAIVIRDELRNIVTAPYESGQ